MCEPGLRPSSMKLPSAAVATRISGAVRTVSVTPATGARVP